VERLIGKVILLACVIAPALGMAANEFLQPTYGYEIELAMLFVLGIISLSHAMHRPVLEALLFYGILCLFPVGAMLQHHATLGECWSIFAGVPFAGVWIIALLGQNIKATMAYTVIAVVAEVVTGLIYGDAGRAGALIIMTIICGIALVAWRTNQVAKLREQVQVARDQLDCVKGAFRSLQREIEEAPR